MSTNRECADHSVRMRTRIWTFAVRTWREGLFPTLRINYGMQYAYATRQNFQNSSVTWEKLPYHIYRKHSDNFTPYNTDNVTPYILVQTFWTIRYYYLFSCLKTAGWVANCVDPVCSGLSIPILWENTVFHMQVTKAQNSGHHEPDQ